jgi:hypothetical protein
MQNRLPWPAAIADHDCIGVAPKDAQHFRLAIIALPDVETVRPVTASRAVFDDKEVVAIARAMRLHDQHRDVAQLQRPSIKVAPRLRNDHARAGYSCTALDILVDVVMVSVAETLQLTRLPGSAVVMM